MYRTGFWILWEKARVGWSERIALKHVYYQGWNRSPVQVGCMRQVLRAGALGRPRGMGWGGRQEGGSGRGAHVNPWLIHVNVWQKPLQYCKVISLQLIKINGKKTKVTRRTSLVVQWLRICLSIQGTWVLFQGWEDPTSLEGAMPMCCNYWALVLVRESRNCWAHALQLHKPEWPRACTPQWEKPP